MYAFPPLLEALRPPIETDSRTHKVATGLEGDTARHLGILQLLKGGKVPIEQDGIGERPQMLGRLEFGRIWGQKQQMDVVRHTEALGAVPARAIQDEHNLFAGTSAYCRSKGGEFSLEE